eukprot:CAMPEP_0170491808 /NCGR_PEP_ID=MMETSP0208-20121228/11267_1 /TAXON_ID=197538 /ORGANISM="Strombidium inclinatum, Strain S3" /LENGTH=87 /DNA_ID=CAMNT_0010767445 /DNA_START=243 /DNA_END=506 /DNA_ORIENTATION=-
MAEVEESLTVRLDSELQDRSQELLAGGHVFGEFEHISGDIALRKQGGMPHRQVLHGFFSGNGGVNVVHLAELLHGDRRRFARPYTRI